MITHYSQGRDNSDHWNRLFGWVATYCGTATERSRTIDAAKYESGQRADCVHCTAVLANLLKRHREGDNEIGLDVR